MRVPVLVLLQREFPWPAFVRATANTKPRSPALGRTGFFLRGRRKQPAVLATKRARPEDRLAGFRRTKPSKPRALAIKIGFSPAVSTREPRLGTGALARHEVCGQV